MKKWLLIFIFLLCSCEKTQKRRLHVFYSSTCGECEVLMDEFIEILPQEIEVISYNMDQIESEVAYEECLNQLQNVSEQVYEHKMTPFLYLENGFGAIGYNDAVKEVYLQYIEDSLNNHPPKEVISGVWICQEE